MKILKLDRAENEVKILINSTDDLIVLGYVIEPHDRLKAHTQRKVKINETQDIKPVTIEIEVESTKAGENELFVSGKITYASEEAVPLHKYHTIGLEVGDNFTLFKRRFLGFQLEMLEKAAKRSPKIFICTYEDGYAIFYRITNYSLSKLYELKENVSGKAFKNESRKAFFKKLDKHLMDEHERQKWDLFIIAGKRMDNDGLKTRLKGIDAVYETVSYADTGLKELMNKDKINELMHGTKLAKQRALIGEYLGAISKGDKNYVYGTANIKAALEKGHLSEAIVTRDFVLDHKDIIEAIDAFGARIVFFDEKDDSLDMLNGFGGIILKIV